MYYVFILEVLRLYLKDFVNQRISDGKNVARSKYLG